MKKIYKNWRLTFLAKLLQYWFTQFLSNKGHYLFFSFLNDKLQSKYYGDSLFYILSSPTKQPLWTQPIVFILNMRGTQDLQEIFSCLLSLLK